MHELLRRYRFEAAHRLPAVPAGHRCARVHGHTYDVAVCVRGDADEELGWVTDFGAIDDVCQPVIEGLDHRLLNDVDGLENPTSENVACWLWDRLHAHLPGLSSVAIAENPDAVCTYWGPAR
jgi:6-pyruvoyltetrahydropterin/6-carboxytetrahydropterin synthase